MAEEGIHDVAEILFRHFGAGNVVERSHIDVRRVGAVLEAEGGEHGALHECGKVHHIVVRQEFVQLVFRHRRIVGKIFVENAFGPVDDARAVAEVTVAGNRRRTCADASAAKSRGNVHERAALAAAYGEDVVGIGLCSGCYEVDGAHAVDVGAAIVMGRLVVEAVGVVVDFVRAGGCAVGLVGRIEPRPLTLFCAAVVQHLPSGGNHELAPAGVVVAADGIDGACAAVGALVLDYGGEGAFAGGFGIKSAYLHGLAAAGVGRRFHLHEVDRAGGCRRRGYFGELGVDGDVFQYVEFVVPVGAYVGEISVRGRHHAFRVGADDVGAHVVAVHVHVEVVEAGLKVEGDGDVAALAGLKGHGLALFAIILVAVLVNVHFHLHVQGYALVVAQREGYFGLLAFFPCADVAAVYVGGYKIFLCGVYHLHFGGGVVVAAQPQARRLYGRHIGGAEDVLEIARAEQSGVGLSFKGGPVGEQAPHAAGLHARVVHPHNVAFLNPAQVGGGDEHAVVLTTHPADSLGAFPHGARGVAFRGRRKCHFRGDVFHLCECKVVARHHHAVGLYERHHLVAESESHLSRHG